MSNMMLLADAATRRGTTMPARSAPNFQPDSFHQLRFAHRGGYAYGPENTLELISHNVRGRGVNAIEVDVQMTRDGYLVLFHDEKISRILQTDRDARVNELTLGEIQAIPLRDERLGEVYVAELGEFLCLMRQLIFLEGRDLMVELDFKTHGKQTSRAVHRMMLDLQRTMAPMGGELLRHLFVSTFYPEVLTEIRKYSKEIVLAFSVNRDSPTQILMSRLAAIFAYYVVRKFDCAIIEPNSSWVTPRFVQRWRRRGILINTFTANSVFDKTYLENLEVAYTTNCPSGVCMDDPTDLIGNKKRWCKTCASTEMAA